MGVNNPMAGSPGLVRNRSGGESSPFGEIVLPHWRRPSSVGCTDVQTRAHTELLLHATFASNCSNAPMVLDAGTNSGPSGVWALAATAHSRQMPRVEKNLIGTIMAR